MMHGGHNERLQMPYQRTPIKKLLSGNVATFAVRHLSAAFFRQPDQFQIHRTCTAKVKKTVGSREEKNAFTQEIQRFSCGVGLLRGAFCGDVERTIQDKNMVGLTHDLHAAAVPAVANPKLSQQPDVAMGISPAAANEILAVSEQLQFVLR
jgi:hypothetical protein